MKRPLFDGIDTPVESLEAVSVTAGLENNAAKGRKNTIRRITIDQNGLHTPVSSMCPFDGQDLDDMNDTILWIDGIYCRKIHSFRISAALSTTRYEFRGCTTGIIPHRLSELR